MKKHYPRTGTYKSWSSVKQRCLNPKATGYAQYGGAGITLCARWMTFANFLADMGERPEGKSIDRWPNGSGNYEPGNCRWAAPREQSLNRSATRWIEYEGKTQSLVEWAEQLGISVPGLISRLRTWTVADALTRPPKAGNQNE